MTSKFLLYDPTLDDWLIVLGGVFVVLLFAFLVTRFTKYGGGSNYGITGEFDDYNDIDSDFD